jgi:large subunit ribosomal protein L4
MDVPVYNMSGKEVGRMTVDEAALGGDINASLIKQAYVRYHTHQRQGSSKTKNRHEVEGSTKKLYKQKGTGNARHGDRKVNLMKGGGHGHSKKKTREDFRLDMPKKMRRKANRNALLAKLKDGEVRVLDQLVFAEPKTKLFESSALVALPTAGQAVENVLKSGRNVDSVTLVRAEQINCFDMLNHRYLVITKADLEAWLKGPWSQTNKSAKVSPLGRKKEVA